MSKYTPGPWRIDYQQDEAPYIVAEQGKAWNNPTICHLYQDVTPEVFVTIGPWLEAFDNATANARLIAAAPELLEALQAALEHLEYCGWGDSFHQECAEDAGLPNMITAAIAKATGDTQ